MPTRTSAIPGTEKLSKIAVQKFGGTSVADEAARISAAQLMDIRPIGVSFVVESKWTRTISMILESEGCRFETDDGFVKVSVVGVGMTGQPGMMATIVDALNDQNIPIYQSTDAQTSISCLIRKQHEKLALQSLHEAFNLDDVD